MRLHFSDLSPFVQCILEKPSREERKRFDYYAKRVRHLRVRSTRNPLAAYTIDLAKIHLLCPLDSTTLIPRLKSLRLDSYTVGHAAKVFCTAPITYLRADIVQVTTTSLSPEEDFDRLMSLLATVTGTLKHLVIMGTRKITSVEQKIRFADTLQSLQSLTSLEIGDGLTREYMRRIAVLPNLQRLRAEAATDMKLRQYCDDFTGCLNGIQAPFRSLRRLEVDDSFGRSPDSLPMGLLRAIPHHHITHINVTVDSSSIFNCDQRCRDFFIAVKRFTNLQELSMNSSKLECSETTWSWTISVSALSILYDLHDLRSLILPHIEIRLGKSDLINIGNAFPLMKNLVLGSHTFSNKCYTMAQDLEVFTTHYPNLKSLAIVLNTSLNPRFCDFDADRLQSSLIVKKLFLRLWKPFDREQLESLVKFCTALFPRAQLTVAWSTSVEDILKEGNYKAPVEYKVVYRSAVGIVGRL